MKKKHENTIFPSSPHSSFFLGVYKPMVTECQNVVFSWVVTSYT